MTFSLEEKKKEIANARKWGISVITGIFGFGLFISEIERLWPPQLSNYPYLLLFLACGGLVSIWIWCSQKELDILFNWLDPRGYTPPTGYRETATIVSLGVVLALLMLSSRNPIYFGIVFTIYNLSVFFGGKHLNVNIKKAIAATNESFNANKSKTKFQEEKKKQLLKGIKILENYFINRPHTPRHLLILILGIVATTIAFLSKFYNIQELSILSYIMYFLIIVISEIYIGYWRNERDKFLDPIEASIRDIIDSEKSHSEGH